MGAINTLASPLAMDAIAQEPMPTPRTVTFAQARQHGWPTGRDYLYQWPPRRRDADFIIIYYDDKQCRDADTFECLSKGI